MGVFLKWLFIVGVFFVFSCNSGQRETVASVDKSFIIENVLNKKVQFIDVRTPKEFQAGAIKGAVNYNVLDKEGFRQHIQKLDKDQPVYLYCKMGGRSSRASKILQDEGFSKIYNYVGGYTDWMKEK